MPLVGWPLTDVGENSATLSRCRMLKARGSWTTKFDPADFNGQMILQANAFNGYAGRSNAASIISSAIYICAGSNLENYPYCKVCTSMTQDRTILLGYKGDVLSNQFSRQKLVCSFRGMKTIAEI
ncbi:uncharacterized protein LOC123920087 [Trifolium pratense]|uniref:uncharacterized protein LOC123920079 n=1 Tax=Trifolium pratense TaxID=57577 RepID=UPI001E6932F8|nr:uncharacterized protein LOC123920079 [Trifolium pratense]XP_045828168.1 uncharacterized protein LOC123920079 [Trifolium pratense]XP_045828169.1 uncharacterized protein LOC123920079 [Trifolium pratense]XP_045828176.1 uncharacterized protein LOC123920087 [Trifolium pratense]XP_045828177.1 uncharacterized protein LOC123920087 [Trifolium pratense]XP_045828178.1 uncharacterized protein LOC123920087 [Trifolium pratense]